MNGDGTKDLIFGDRAGYIQFYSRSTSGALNYEGRIKAGGSDLSLDLQAASPCIVDWNGDGLLDIIVGAGIWKTKIPLRLYLNEGSKTSYQYNDFKYLFYGNDTISATYPQIEVKDFDGDGIKDMLLQDCFYDSWLGGDTTNLFFFKNIGTNANPQFSSRDTVKYNGQPIKSKLAKLDSKDLNNDGTIDIAVSGTGRDITIYFNDHPVSSKNFTQLKELNCSIKRTGNSVSIQGIGLTKWKLYSLSGKLLLSGNLTKNAEVQYITIKQSANMKILSIKTINHENSHFKIF